MMQCSSPDRSADPSVVGPQ